MNSLWHPSRRVLRVVYTDQSGEDEDMAATDTVEWAMLRANATTYLHEVQRLADDGLKVWHDPEALRSVVGDLRGMADLLAGVADSLAALEG